MREGPDQIRPLRRITIFDNLTIRGVAPLARDKILINFRLAFAAVGAGFIKTDVIGIAENSKLRRRVSQIPLKNPTANPRRSRHSLAD